VGQALQVESSLSGQGWGLFCRQRPCLWERGSGGENWAVHWSVQMNEAMLVHEHQAEEWGQGNVWIRCSGWGWVHWTATLDAAVQTIEDTSCGLLLSSCSPYPLTCRSSERLTAPSTR
jgi:hypothetical protein